jgi:omega-hydroxy-beta-dihydromenaquinone-9 sulfotransferase
MAAIRRTGFADTNPSFREANPGFRRELSERLWPMNEDNRSPVFVVGTGRSGSTVFFELLARHPDVVWLSRLADEHPRDLWMNRLLLRACSLRFLEPALRRFYGPSEAYGFWNTVCPGFANPFRDLVAEDVIPAVAERVRKALSDMTTPSRPRFLGKITGWPRIGFLNEIFPDATFIHVRRDARATACSLLEVPFWDGWRGPPNWRRGPLPVDLEAAWQKEDYSFVALAALEIAVVDRAMARCRAMIGDQRIHVVEYAELCEDPVSVMKRVCSFCGLDWPSRFADLLEKERLINRDTSWQARLTTSQCDVLVRTLARAGIDQG